MRAGRSHRRCGGGRNGLRRLGGTLVEQVADPALLPRGQCRLRLLAQVGQEGLYAHDRFTFGWDELAGGFALIPALVGAFGLAEKSVPVRRDLMALATLVFWLDDRDRARSRAAEEADLMHVEDLALPGRLRPGRACVVGALLLRRHVLAKLEPGDGVAVDFVRAKAHLAFDDALRRRLLEPLDAAQRGACGQADAGRQFVVGHAAFGLHGLKDA